ncbi:hypothetical protein LguiA_013727 [Lonicera macranthoides]
MLGSTSDKTILDKVIRRSCKDLKKCLNGDGRVQNLPYIFIFGMCSKLICICCLILWIVIWNVLEFLASFSFSHTLSYEAISASILWILIDWIGLQIYCTY